jgi:hypothetical protein
LDRLVTWSCEIMVDYCIPIPTSGTSMRLRGCSGVTTCELAWRKTK